MSGRKSVYQKSRYKVFKIRMRLNGKPKEIQTASLYKILKSNKKLKKHLRKPLKENGLNVEGLSYHLGRLYVGFRSPIINGEAQILSIKAKELFKNSDKLKIKNYSIDLGGRRGIRSLEHHDNQLYILSGRSNNISSSNAEITFN